METDDEQIAAIKDWWNEYGRSIITGLLLSVVTIGGWNFWTSHQQSQGEAASALYYDMIEASAKVHAPDKEDVDEADITAFVELADQLKSEYGSTEYGHYAGLFKAKDFVLKNKNAKAIEELNWVLASGPNKNIKLLTSLRLARLYLAESQLDKAQKLAATTNAGTYESMFLELTGDIAVKQGDKVKAKEFYNQARLKVDGQQRPELDMKYYNLLEN